MNTSSKIEMKILDDLYSSDNSSITRSYVSYYETTTQEQSRIVVEDVLKNLIKTNPGTLECVFDENPFTLTSKI